ncbi:hypothetical protein LJC06_01755 [Bacteroidales bacterium OttesenSCG-928-I14]|nr:hypothetical protein [Bacteroidales bacterium OttesenSCG-928-I14]
MHNSPHKFSIPEFRPFVPEKLRPWIILLFFVFFQLSGGVYLATASEMIGSLSLMQEDIMMSGYASLAGMALVFTVMFRLKFRYTLKLSLMVCSSALVVCNLICIHTQSVPVLVITCFIAGIFRMWGTFACNSTIQLWITPSRDMSVFFCYIHLFVQACMQLSGLISVYISFFAAWEYMHLLVIGLLCCMMFAVMTLFRSHRSIKKLPLYGIDWMGGLLWGITILLLQFICIYGEHYDWFESVYIRAASITVIVVLALNLWRASYIRHPYIALSTWKHPVVYLTFLSYLVIHVLLAPSHIFEHLYMEAILGYESLNTISLNWVALIGVVAGSFFTYQTFALRKWRYRTMNVIGFSFIAAYLITFYFLIDYNLSKDLLALPILLRSLGYVIIGISYLTSLARVPFPNFPQALTIQAFVSAGFGGVFGTAIVGHILKLLTKSNAMVLGTTLDSVNPLASKMPLSDLYGILQQQSLMVSMKELFGWLAILCIVCLLLFFLRESSIRPKYLIHPTYKAIRKLVAKQEM